MARLGGKGRGNPVHMVKRKYVSTEHFNNNGKKVKEKYFTNNMRTRKKGNTVTF